MGDRAYLSIGEVLSLLKDEFPDVTISKIRFLESQGLLDPERTASGYRKFYDADVERLRWILRQQREHFLPLKVIKGRLGVGDPADRDAVEADATDAGHPSGPAPSAAGADTQGSARSTVTAARPEPDPLVAVTPAGPPTAGASAEPAPAAGPSASARSATAGAGAPAPGPAAGSVASGGGREPALSAGMSGVNLTLEELASATGLPYERLRELERYGFIAGRPVAGTVYYDEEALVVANLAVGFARFGIEGRHLRIYKNSAEREAGLFEQIVTPLLKQRNPEARRQAQQALEDLTQLGQSLRAAVLRQAIRRLSGG